MARANDRPMKVLIVDDNADLVEMLSLVVQAAGHETRTALDGPSAVTVAATFQPDVVLLDLGMPQMGGMEVARQLRERAETSQARIVALTGWSHEDERERTEAAGFDYHLTKPADPETVERLLAGIAAGMV